jgi:hypothetical protein
MLGHSDRRNTLGEDDALLAAKVRACLRVPGLGVNLTVGETRAARDAGDALAVLGQQLGAAVAAARDEGAAEWAERFVVACVVAATGARDRARIVARADRPAPAPAWRLISSPAPRS